MPVAWLAADTFQRQTGFAALPFVRTSQRELRRFFTSLFVKTGILARQGAFPKCCYQRRFKPVIGFACLFGLCFATGCHVFPQVDRDEVKPRRHPDAMGRIPTPLKRLAEAFKVRFGEYCE